MSEDWQAQIYDLMEKADGASGAEKIALLDEALRLADLQKDLERATYIREELFQALYWDGQFVRALAEFNIMLAAADQHADSWGADFYDRLLWLYKWVADNPQKYLSVSRPQMEAMFADIRRRYEQQGLSLRAIHALRCTFSVDVGEIERAKEAHKLWMAAEEDGSEDCAACELSAEVDFLVDIGEVDAALKKAKPLFAGKLRCEEVPNTTFSFLLPTLVRKGQLERAARAQAMSIKQMRESRKFLGYLGQHLQYFALIGEWTKGIKLLESRLAWAFEVRNNQDQFLFFLGARLLLARLAKSGKATTKIMLPESFPHVRPDGTYDTQKLADQFYALAKDLAGQFDRRNGNDRYEKLLAENEALIAFDPPNEEIIDLAET